MAYATLADLKTYLGVSSSDDDTLLTDLIARAQALIDGYCNRTFEMLVDSTRAFDALRDVGDGGRKLYIYDDLAEITSVTNGDSTTVASSAYVKRADGLLLKASAGIVWTYDEDPEDAISVTGKWAYSETAPVAIEQACIRLAAYLYRQRSSQSETSIPVVTTTGAVILPNRLPDDLKAILDPYRKRVG